MFERLVSVLRDMTIIGGVLFVSCYGSYRYFDTTSSKKHAVTVTDFRAVNPNVKIGEPLVLTISGVVNRLCPIEYHRLLKDTSGVVVWRDSKPGTARDLGPFKDNRLAVYFPSEIKPGVYIYSSIGYPDCPDDSWSNPVKQPDLSITLTSNGNAG